MTELAADSAVSGPAVLGGTLRVELLDGFSPALGDAFTVLTAGSLTGGFATIEAPTLADASLRLRVGVEGGAVVVRFATAADFNGDGVVNPDDLSDYINAFFVVPAGPEADFNLDGIVNPDDLADFINAFFAG